MLRFKTTTVALDSKNCSVVCLQVAAFTAVKETCGINSDKVVMILLGRFGWTLERHVY
jgi:hypothetical protein